MKVITVWNMKGGVGKTTLAFNLALELEKRSGQRILCLDLDPQANLTSFFERKKSVPRGKASVQALAQHEFEGLKKAIYRLPGRSVDYIRSENQAVEPAIMASLYHALLEIEETYSYVVIDCPPSFDHAVQSAIYASDLVLVPITLDAFSRDNLNLVQSKIHMIEQTIELNELDPDDEEQVDIPWRVVANRVANRKSQKEVFSDLLYRHDYPIFDFCIGESAVVSSANLRHKPIREHRSTSAVANDIYTLIDWIKEEV